jgi:ribonuclease P protein component
MNLFGFPKAMRLTRKREFEEVYRDGKRFKGTFITLYYLSGDAPPRLGISISHALRGTVERNRIKRQIREFFRLNKGLFKGGTFVVGVNAKAKEKGGDEIRDELRRLVEMVE